MGSYYHSTYSSRSREISVPFHKSLWFGLLDLHLDPDGRYVILHAICDGVKLVVVGIFIPPANMSVLHKIKPILTLYATENNLLAGDFNMPLILY